MPPKAAPIPDPIKDAQLTLRGFKSNITRILNSSDVLIHLRADISLVTRLEEAIASIETALEKFKRTSYQLIELDPDSFDTYDDNLSTEFQRCDQAKRDIFDFILQCRQANIAPQAPAHQPPAPAAGRIKTYDALKPFTLTRDHTPAELRNWILQFKAFYSTSQMDQLNIEDQQAFLRICVEPLLYERFRFKIGAATPVFDANPAVDSCIRFLEDEFSLQYPLFLRRLDFFRASQTKGQAFSDFLTKLDSQAEEADLLNLGPEDIYIFRYICACTDTKLKEKLLKLDNPTREDIKRTTHNYESTQINLKAFDVAKANKATAKNQGQKSGRNQNQNQNHNRNQNQNQRKTPNFLKGKCWRCASDDHQAGDCKHKNATCKYCKKKGHTIAACIKRHYKNSQTASKAHSRASSTTPTRESSPNRSQPPATTHAVTRMTVNRPTPRINIRYQVGATSFQFHSLPDTGATRSIISHSLILKHAIPILPSNEQLYAANGQSMTCQGHVILSASINNSPSHDIDAIVSSDLQDDILLSWHDMQNLHIIP